KPRRYFFYDYNCGYNILWICLCWHCRSGWLFRYYFKFIFKYIKSKTGLIASTILGSLIIIFTSGVASISIIMVGVLMRDAYKDQNLPPETLSRTLEDSGTMVLAFVPWGVSAIYY